MPCALFVVITETMVVFPALLMKLFTLFQGETLTFAIVETFTTVVIEGAAVLHVAATATTHAIEAGCVAINREVHVVHYSAANGSGAKDTKQDETKNYVVHGLPHHHI